MKKRLLSLIMAVMMVVVLVVPAAAATTDTASDGTVTVYVTYGMFTEGGYLNSGMGAFPAPIPLFFSDYERVGDF